MKEDNGENKELQSTRDRFQMDPPENAWNLLDADLERKQAALYRQRGNRFKLLSISLALLLVSSVAYYYISPSRQLTSLDTAVVSHDQVTGAHKAVVKKEFSAGTHSEVGVSSTNDTPVSKRGLGTRNNATLPFVSRSSSFRYKKAANEEADATSGQRDGELAAEEKRNDITNNEEASAVAQPAASAGDLTKEASKEENDLTPDSDNTSKNEAVCEDNSASPSPANEGVKSNDTASVSKLVQNINTKSRWSVDAFYSPNYYSHNHLTDNSTAYGYNASDYSSLEKSNYSYAAGLRLRYDLTSHWSISAGDTYSTIAYSTTLPAIYAKYGSDDQLHYEYPTSCGNIEIPNAPGTYLNYGDTLHPTGACTQTVQFISVPVSLRYKIGEGRLTYYADAGVLVNFVLQEKASMSIWNTEYNIVNHIDGLNAMNYGYLFGAGMEYSLYNNIGIFIEPSFRGSITSLTQNTAYNCYPYAFNVNMGVSFRF